MATPEWIPPGEFDEYRLVRQLGHGAMGQVWLALDTLLERRVAIKFMAALDAEAEARERFLTEARAIARLTHPNVVSIHRVGTLEGQPYAVTELIDGESLDRLEKPVPTVRALAIAVDLACGLAAAHRAGILHRDVKPANAMVGPAGAKLLDFGLAKIAAGPRPDASEGDASGKSEAARAASSTGPPWAASSSGRPAAPSVSVGIGVPPPRLGSAPASRSDAEAANRHAQTVAFRTPEGRHSGVSDVWRNLAGSGAGLWRAETGAARMGSPHGERVPVPARADINGTMSPPRGGHDASSGSDDSTHPASLERPAPAASANLDGAVPLPRGVEGADGSQNSAAAPRREPSLSPRSDAPLGHDGAMVLPSVRHVATAAWRGARERPEAPPDEPSMSFGIGATLTPPRSSRSEQLAPPPPHDLTQAGVVMGTPWYMAPECWRGEPASRRSDVFSFGALVYELCAGDPPARYLPEGPLAEVLTRHDAKPLVSVAPHVDPGLAAVVDKCLQREPSKRFASGDELREALERLLHAGRAHLPEGDPYRGLLPFEAEHRALFFGRSSEVRGVLERLRARGLVVVAGESGVGKSSLCRAGVVPSVLDGALGTTRRWTALTVVPGRHPFRALVAACSDLLAGVEGDLVSALREEPTALARHLVRALGADRGLLLFIDQLEEWVSFGDPEEAALAARAVFELSSGLPGVRVLATSRSDLLPALTRLPLLGAELSSSLYLLGPVQKEQLRAIVEEPAQAHGVCFESPAMVDALVEFASSGGALPLLQFALSRLWENRGGSNVLTAASLAAMGGVTGALAQHADGVLERLPADQAHEAKQMLLALVSSGDKRRRRPERELVGEPPQPARQAALTTLAAERIVMARDSAEGAGWELAHEVLLREWPTLRRWLSESEETRAAQERLQLAAREWQRLGRSPEALWGPAQLRDVASLSAQRLEDPAWAAFLTASRRRARIRKLSLPLIVAALALAGGGTYAAQRWSQARAVAGRVAAQLAQVGAHLTEAQRANAERGRSRAEALAHFDAGAWPQGEKAWEKTLSWRQATERALGKAMARAENAFLLAPERVEVRQALAACIAERLSLARADAVAMGQTTALPADTERLKTLDVEGRFAHLLDSATRVEVEGLPAQATAKLERFEAEQGRSSALPLGAFPAGAELAAGSYLLQASAPGFAPLRLPFRVLPGAPQTLRAELVPRAKVPEGFLYIPRGAVLFGAAGDEKVRREFYEAAPVHPVELEPFLVGTHEVTFAEWLTFLEALPPARREKHLPRTQSSIGGTTETAFQDLALTSSGWRFTFAPLSHRYTARAGEKIRYLERDRRVEHDWRHFPVTAITPNDMLAYADWLEQSGRLKGARLCTEPEWERVARGADARTFPHGDVFEPDDANLDETYGYRDAAYGPDEVGSHPASASPFGAHDMLGNAWEVVRSVNAAKQYVVRGGSWHVGQISARIPNSWVVNADFRQVDTGFRVCASVPP